MSKGLLCRECRWVYITDRMIGARDHIKNVYYKHGFTIIRKSGKGYLVKHNHCGRTWVSHSKFLRRQLQEKEKVK